MITNSLHCQNASHWIYCEPHRITHKTKDINDKLSSLDIELCPMLLKWLKVSKDDRSCLEQQARGHLTDSDPSKVNKQLVQLKDYWMPAKTKKLFQWTCQVGSVVTQLSDSLVSLSSLSGFHKCVRTYLSLHFNGKLLFCQKTSRCLRLVSVKPMISCLPQVPSSHRECLQI